MRDLQLARATTAQVTSLHFVFKPYGWATFYLDDAQGTLAVESDWGSWAHRWGRGSHLDASHDLSAALKGRIGDDPDYIARKLFGSSVEEYDASATADHWRELIIERRRSQRIDRELARAAWEQVDEIDLTSADVAWARLDYGDFPELGRALGNDWSEIFVRTKRREFLLMRDVLLPAFVAELRRSSAEMSGAAQEGGSRG